MAEAISASMAACQPRGGVPDMFEVSGATVLTPTLPRAWWPAQPASPQAARHAGRWQWAAAPATVGHVCRFIYTAQMLAFLGHEAKSDREEHFAA